MNTALSCLSFRDVRFDVVDRSGQPWLRVHQIGEALGYSRPDAINTLYQSNADEFTDAMTALVKLHHGNDGAGQMRETRIFSLRGCHLLGMFARTEVAKDFRKWVLDVLDQQTGAGVTAVAPKPDPAVLAQQLADLLQGKVLVDYDTLGQLTRTLWGAQGLLEGIEPLAQTLEQQCGKKLINKNFEQEPPRQPRQTRQLRQTLSSEDGKPSAYQKVLDFITTEKGKGVGDQALQSHCWPYRNLPADKREALIKQLLDDGAIVEVQPESKPGARRKALVYVAQSYAKAVS